MTTCRMAENTRKSKRSRPARHLVSARNAEWRDFSLEDISFPVLNAFLDGGTLGTRKLAEDPGNEVGVSPTAQRTSPIVCHSIWRLEKVEDWWVAGNRIWRRTAERGAVNDPQSHTSDPCRKSARDRWTVVTPTSQSNAMGDESDSINRIEVCSFSGTEISLPLDLVEDVGFI